VGKFHAQFVEHLFASATEFTIVDAIVLDIYTSFTASASWPLADAAVRVEVKAC